MGQLAKTPVWWMSSSEQEAVQWRAAQSHVDSDIEGLARDTDADALLHQMDADKISIEEQLAKLTDFFLKKSVVVEK